MIDSGMLSVGIFNRAQFCNTYLFRCRGIGDDVISEIIYQAVGIPAPLETFVYEILTKYRQIAKYAEHGVFRRLFHSPYHHSILHWLLASRTTS